MKKFYIAFSIERTNCFMVATKEAESVEALGPGFVECTERHPSFALLCDGEKVFWEKLINPNTFKPLTNPINVMGKFYELERSGWILPEHSKKTFIAKHFPRKTQKTVVYNRLFGH